MRTWEEFSPKEQRVARELARDLDLLNLVLWHINYVPGSKMSDVCFAAWCMKQER